VQCGEVRWRHLGKHRVPIEQKNAALEFLLGLEVGIGIGSERLDQGDVSTGIRLLPMVTILM